ncbi:MAG: hypothetical protein WAM30_10665 [Candidatus Dormiibacterota bacterium]
MKVKRTYQLSSDTVEAVRKLVQQEHAAPSQDALVETALQEYIQRRRYQDESAVWAVAANDPSFREEVAQLEEEFQTADRAIWPE